MRIADVLHAAYATVVKARMRKKRFSMRFDLDILRLFLSCFLALDIVDSKIPEL